MDFFASQELARKNTRKLIGLLVLTVVVLILAIYALVLLIFGGLSKGGETVNELIGTRFLTLDNLGLIIAISVVVISVVSIGSLLKTFELRRGGASVADMLGGRRLLPNTTDFSERRILNIVEEMSLASGVPVPPVYVLDQEPGINAFAAGHTIDDAVIGVNRGTIEKLNRNELQGVIAHEFSHILNGDMRMSLRMIGLLHGIQGIALIGYYVLRSASYMSSGRSSNNDKGGGPAAVLLALGVGLLAIGSIGLFFARLIKASVSRQREYLADASAVQFTRLPDGISGALKMIGANHQTSKVEAPDAESISHMFFANMAGSKLQSFFATHPPLVPRIQRIEPRFGGNFGEYLQQRPTASVVDRQEEEQQHRRHLEIARRFGFDFGKMGAAVAMPVMAQAVTEFPANSREIVSHIGAPSNDDVVYSQLLVEHVSESFLHDCRDVFSARCIVFASLMDRDPKIADRQLRLLIDREKEATARETVRLRKIIETIPDRIRLPIFEILQGTLVGMSQEQLLHFQQTLRGLVAADQQIDLFEFFLLHHLLVHLRRHLGVESKAPVRYKSLGELPAQTEWVLSIVARHGHESDDEARAAFAAAVQGLPTLNRPIEFSGGEWNFVKLNDAIKELSQLSFEGKKDLLTAVATSIIHDQTITHTEAELFRAIAESLDCPVPPIVATEKA